MQEVLTIKEKLHQRIEGIDDEKILEAFYTILENYKNEAEDYVISDTLLQELEKREADYLSGKDKAIPLEEFMQATKIKYGF